MSAKKSIQTPNTQGWLFLSFIALGSLLAMTGLRQFFIAPLPEQSSNYIWFAVQALPLLIPLPGLIFGSLRATFIICIMSNLYFIHGVLALFNKQVVYAGLEITFALALCIFTAVLVRKIREAQAQSPPPHEQHSLIDA